MTIYKRIFILLLGLLFSAIMYTGCERDDVGVDSNPESSIWVDEYKAQYFYFPVDIVIVPESTIIYKWEDTKIEIVKEIHSMKSILFLDMVTNGFYVDIFEDDTDLVNHYSGKYSMIKDTIRFNVGDSIIQDYGFQFLSPDSLFIYDFVWADSSRPIMFNVPTDCILWQSGFAGKNKGIFVRHEYIENRNQ